MGAESSVYLGGTATYEEISEVVSEGKKIIEVAPRLQDIPQNPVIARDDAWFVFLDVASRESTYVPPGTAKSPCAAFQTGYLVVLSCANIQRACTSPCM